MAPVEDWETARLIPLESSAGIGSSLVAARAFLGDKRMRLVRTTALTAIRETISVITDIRLRSTGFARVTWGIATRLW
jgi:hypothetical protein